MRDHLKLLRVGAHMSQGELSKKLHIHQTTYSAYEQGSINIPIPTLIQLSELFNTSVDYILDLTNEIKPYPRSQKQD